MSVIPPAPMNLPKPLEDDQLDGFGFPWFWHRMPPDDFTTSESAEHWSLFEQWCQEQGRRAFPATRETVLDFLRESPVQGRQLYDTWIAVDLRHFADYWHTDANPVLMLRDYVTVTEEGIVTLSDGLMHFERWGYDFEGPYQEVESLKNQPGLIVRWCQQVYEYGSTWQVMAIQYSNDVQQASVAMNIAPSVHNKCRGVIHYAALYNVDDPEATLSAIRAAFLEEETLLLVE